MSGALLFPGQGSQWVGMGRRLASLHDAARRTFEEADDTLGFALSRVCFEGPEDVLRRTEHAQPAILAVSVATWRALSTTIALEPRWLVGHSLGEYSALVVAGALSLADALRLVRTRGRLMQAAVPADVGAMAAIVRLDEATVAALCRQWAQGSVVAPANFNGAGQTVIAGHRDAVARVADAARAAGGKVLPLAVSAPFHCALMAPAAAGLAEALAPVPIAPLAWPVIANVDAEPHDDPTEVRALLIAQVTAPVRWAESMQRLRALGCTRTLELGPGQALTKIVQRMRLGLEARSAGEEDAATWRAWDGWT